MNPKETQPGNVSPIHPRDETRKPYTPPAILHELALETRAGSALGADPVETILGIPTK